MRRVGCLNFKGVYPEKTKMDYLRSLVPSRAGFVRFLRAALPALALTAFCGLGFAEGTGALPESVTTAITEFQTTGTNLINAIMPAVKALLIAMFGIVAVWFCYKQVRRILGR